MQSLNKPRRQIIVLLGLFCASVLLFSAIMCCVPLSSDDFEFSTMEFSGMGDIVRYALYYGNGRLLGNLGAVSLARMPVLAVAVKALLISGIIFMLPYTLGIRDTTGYLLSFLLFVSIRSSLFGQVYTWTSGFQNYIPPVWVLLAILILLRRCDNVNPGAKKAALCALIFFLGLAGQLYVEHITIINLLLAAVLVIERRRSGRKCAPALIWLCAALVGLALMLLIPRLFHVDGNRTEGYRAVNVGALAQMIYFGIKGLSDVGSAFPPLGSMAVCGLTLVSLRMTARNRSERKTAFLSALSLLCFFWLFFNEFVLRDIWQGRMLMPRNALNAGFALLPFALGAIALYRLEDRATRNKIYFLLAFALLSLLPFALVHPAPERVVFLSYVFASAAILEFYSFLTESAEATTLRRVGLAVRCAAVSAVVLLGLVFSNILWLSHIRESHILREMEKGATEITLFKIPHEYVFWDGPYLFGRGYYYETWHDITFRQAEFEVWYAEHWMK